MAHRVPLNIFGIAFGVTGLATAWHAAATTGLVPLAVSTGLFVVATAVWAVSLVGYLRWALAAGGRLTADLQDRTAGPFAALVVIVPILVAANGLAPYAPSVARVVADVFIVLVVLLGGCLTGVWMRGGTDIDRLHPGYFLPTVAGGLVASVGAATVGQRRLAEVLFGLGIICWMILGSMILARLIFRPPLPDPLAPTMAIELAPAAVASLAYFAINGRRIDLVVAILGGYGLLMVLAQLPLLGRYRRLPFMVSTWSHTFSWAAVISVLVVWLGITRPVGGGVLAYVALAGLTALIGGIALRTGVALARRTLLPTLPGPPGLNSADRAPGPAPAVPSHEAVRAVAAQHQLSEVTDPAASLTADRPSTSPTRPPPGQDHRQEEKQPMTIAPTSSPAATDTTEPTAPTTPEGVVRRYLEDFVNGGSIDALKAVWAADGSWHGGSMGEHHGIEEMVAFAEAGGAAAFTDMHLVVEDVIVADDKVVVRFTNNGTQTGPFMGAPASGKHASWLGIGIYTVTEGRIGDAWFGEDILGMLLQLGVVTLPA